MLLVVADTGPLRYLVLIGQIDLLPLLFQNIVIPTPVYAELCHQSAPVPVRQWATALPVWIEVLPAASTADPVLRALDEGEKSAITLGLTLRADLILIDDRRGRIVARQKGFDTTGTLGVLTRAAQMGFVDLAAAIAKLKETNFHYRQQFLDDLLKQYGDKNG